MSTDTRTATGARPDFLARFLDVMPLLVVYFAMAALYAWQASRHPVPTIFTDELETTQLSRAISETGEAARRGEPYGIPTLIAYFLAPVWWLTPATTAYAAAKLLLVLTMTAALFPAYALARMVVPRWWAIGAAGAAVAVPALAYSPVLVEEPLAYPLSTTALWLTARLLAQPSWGRLAVVLGVSAAAAATRTQLAVLFAVVGLGLLWVGWESASVRRWRSEWSRSDWVGAVTLTLGAVLAFSAAMGHLSTAWRNTTFLYKDRIFEHATWAAGALAIGVGVLPLAIAIAALARPKSEPRDPRTRAFVVTTAASIGAFLWYAGIKGAFLSTVFATYIYERNVIYLLPLLMAGTALAFARGVGRGWAIAVGVAVAVYAANATPIELKYPYYEAPGLAILAFANRELGWSAHTIDNAVLTISLVAVAIVVALRLLRRGSLAAVALTAVAGVAVVAWSLTTEVYAAEGGRIQSEQIAGNLAEPFDWVERATGGAPVVVIGQQINDPTNLWLTEFFNPSVRKMWSLDGSAPGPGPILTPDLQATDGTLTPPPEVAYALAVNGVQLRGPVIARRENAVLYRVDGGPLRLKQSVTGRTTDGWMVAKNGEKVARAAYTRYDVSGDGPGFAVVKLSRIGWCPEPGKRTTAKATIRIGPVGIGPDKQPAISDVTDTQTVTVLDCQTRARALAAPGGRPWRVEVVVEPTFSPNEIDPSNSDRRQLGAQLDVDFQPLFG